jgi:hypothetical protein
MLDPQPLQFCKYDFQGTRAATGPSARRCRAEFGRARTPPARTRRLASATSRRAHAPNRGAMPQDGAGESSESRSALKSCKSTVCVASAKPRSCASRCAFRIPTALWSMARTLSPRDARNKALRPSPAPMSSARPGAEIEPTLKQGSHSALGRGRIRRGRNADPRMGLTWPKGRCEGLVA